MGRQEMDGKEKGHLKRTRRARGGRRPSQNDAGVHEDKKSKKLERELEDEANREMRDWAEDALEELKEGLKDLVDDDDDNQEYWEDYINPEEYYDWDE